MKTSLLITTYNWPQALHITLASLKNQTQYPDEIIIADDGSTDETKMLIDEWRKKIDIPIIHSWQEDLGFRLASSRNKAISKSSADYIIMIDGDLVLHPSFIEDHIKHSSSNQFTIGPRVLLNKDYSLQLLEEGKPTFFVKSNQILANKKNTIRSKVLSDLFSHRTTSYKNVRGCNMAFFKDSLLNVNGFNEDFVGWGREDTELTVRLLNAGVNRKNIKFNANTLHIYHPESNRKMLPINDEILSNTIQNKLSRCVNGLDKYCIQ